MSKVFFAGELEGVATFWRIYRRDGVALGFAGHDRDLFFGGMLHRAAPGVLPAALRRTDRFDGDSAEMQGPLGHWSIDERDLMLGRFDGAAVQVGAVDWESLESTTLFHGTLGPVSQAGSVFTAELLSAKAALDVDPVPRTGPTCRAAFCGPGCTLSGARFTRRAKVLEADAANARLRTDIADPSPYRFGQLRWRDGRAIGTRTDIAGTDGAWLVLASDMPPQTGPGATVELREGCDHTLTTCAARFGNAANFRGEPFLPGNDLVARYPAR